MSFVIFILKDPNYYNIKEKELPQKLGTIGTYTEVINIILECFLGVIFDTFGRKLPIIIGFFLAALSIGGIPLFKSLFPSYLILRSLISVGICIAGNAPLMPDYVQKESMGLANGYNEVVITCAFIFASSGLY